MAKQKNEAVSVSFHYLCRSVKQSDGSSSLEPFGKSTFESLHKAMCEKPPVNTDDPKVADRLRFKMEVPIENIVRIDERTIFGSFKSSYWGHEYENTARGKIPADSISLRPFYFILYFGKSGRIYVGSQYLGQFGGYTGLQRTISDLLGGSDAIESHSFRLGSHAYKDAYPKEIRVSFADKSSSISKMNQFGNSGMLVFKRGPKDLEFSEKISKGLFSKMGKSKSEMKKAVAELISESTLIDFKDTDIEDCTVLANVNGHPKLIYLIEDGSFATKFPLAVPLKLDGHPEREITREAMIKLLRDEIISRNEDV